VLWLSGAVVLVGALGGGFALPRHTPPVLPEAAPEPRRQVGALGRLEPGEGLLNISGPEGLRVQSLAVRPHQAVKAGDLLALLENHAQLQADLRLAQDSWREARDRHDAETRRGEARIKEAETSLRQAEELTRQEIETRQARLKASRTLLELAESQFARRTQLRDSGGISSEEIEQKRLDLDCCQSRVAEMRSELVLAQARERVGVALARDQVATARAEMLAAQRAIGLDSLKARIALAQAFLDRAEIRAPVDGEIIHVFTFPGERLGSKPLLQMGETGRMYAVAEVYETDVRHVRVGQRGRVTSPALSADLSGVVERVGRRIYKNDVLHVDPRADSDYRVVEVRLRLEEPAAAARFIFLQVDVRIDVSTPDSSENKTEG
jgi:HlyD family secretion protein